MLTHPNDVINFHYGYCSNDNAKIKTHAEFKVIVDKSFKELNRFLEENALHNFKKENEIKYNNFENITCNLYFSIVGHSLGGLISRDLVKKIYSPFEKDTTQYTNYFEYLKTKFTFLTTVKPCSFLTLSTPHLGSLACNESGGIFKTAEKTAVRMYCNYLSGKIGKVFTYKDGKKGNEKPTLIRLSQKEYMNAYENFPNRTLIGCIRHDIPVKFCSAMGNIEHPIDAYKNENLLIDEKKGKADTRICSYSGYEGQELEYYQKEIFNEKISKNMYYPDTKHLPSPDIEEQIKNGLKKINYKEDENSILKYEDMENVFIPDTINQVEVAVSTLKLFNEIAFRRIIIDFSLSKLARVGTHTIYIGNDIIPYDTPTLAMISKSVGLFSNIILADYLLTSNQYTFYSLNDIVNNEEEGKKEKLENKK
ncbi:hypothetical protein BCR36DRAFT_405519 [Piromyces finnis]|uniref:DUF676 domain-containing protein n=1 Tax=Piromyces finnis TaxID=1754191 RepID=A0A1Y1V668_9FUNG|nr:hypothetical protein BCR36DRAFT_405519 [Piromyces finnis]|eukprot:ORX46913.1 hypothetical protein BCR36DRAFT_405519 [Piromyces finnis]